MCFLHYAVCQKFCDTSEKLTQAALLRYEVITVTVLGFVVQKLFELVSVGGIWEVGRSWLEMPEHCK